MRQLVIKPGSIMLWKSYGKLKRWWYKLIGKNLPYNNPDLRGQWTDPEKILFV